MKTRIPAICLAFFAFTLAAGAQPKASPRFFLNGTDWNAISNLTSDGDFVKALKVYTLEGVFDGLTGLLAENGPADFPKNTDAVAAIIPHETTGQIIDGLDKFYVDAKNAPVPLMLALPIITRQAAGAPPEQIQAMTDKAQKIAAELNAAKTLDDFSKISQEIIANNLASQPKSK